MYKRELTVLQVQWLARLHYVVKDILETTRFLITIKGDSHPYTDAANIAPPVLSFLTSECQRGEAALVEMGIDPTDDWFVCFHGRDLAYLNEWRPQYRKLFEPTAYRNSDEQNYDKAIDLVTKEGGKCIRMGAVVNTPPDWVKTPGVVDYATSFRQDFMDIYLPWKCRFFIGTNSGYSFVPTLFNRPQGLVDQIPACRIPAGPKDMFITKMLYNKDEQRFISFDEMHEIGLFRIGVNHEIPDICRENGLMIIDNSPEEIADLVQDLIDQDSGLEASQDAAELQELFFNRFISDINGFEHAGARIGARFALKYQTLITR